MGASALQMMGLPKRKIDSHLHRADDWSQFYAASGTSITVRITTAYRHQWSLETIP